MQSASKIENALITALPHALLLRLSWPGHALGSDADGMLCLDFEGWITGANPVARQMVPGLAAPGKLIEVAAVMIRKAVDDARGNVGQAARALGISRATLYRKLGQKSS